MKIGATLVEGATVTNGAAVMVNGARRCLYCWNPVVLELTDRNLRSSYVRWPVLRGLFLMENTEHTISDNHILELTLQTMKWRGKLNWWITIIIFNNHLNYSPTLELVQESNGAISQSVASQQPDLVIGSAI